MEILFVLVLGVLAVGAYVFLKSEKKDSDSYTPVETPVQKSAVTEQTVTLAPPPYPALEAKDVKEELAKVISQVAETKQEPAVVETPVVVTEQVAPKPKAKPAAKKATAPKAKKKK